MLIELPSVEIILAGLVIFLLGFFTIIIYFKVKSYVNIKTMNNDPAQLERLEYYERQLIDLKIRLDTIDLENMPESEAIKSKKTTLESSETEQVKKSDENRTFLPPVVPVSKYNDVIDVILHAITDKSMTSRDIQITIGRTREHTSRLMKKLSSEGLVQRHSGTKPYVYSITKEGEKRLKMKPTLS
ncbi:MAG: putative membrane protein [Cenarchaeum symbiont of Oopsacas minuta]|nr:putative membrane protein [Cenarchaeum symbiont of Oopsacas minuta]